jgi:hypothetical protein
VDHDVPLEEVGNISPSGVYNRNNTTVFVTVGLSQDTSEGAVESISCWWERVGKRTNPGSKGLYLPGDCGGSNKCR